VQACGTGVDEAATHAARACACAPNFKAFGDQPSGRCEDCAALHVRRAVDPAVCTAIPPDDRNYGGTPLAPDAYTRLLDVAFEDGSGVFNDDSPLDCGATWSRQPNVWVPHYPLQLPSIAADMMKTVVHDLGEARIGCHAYFPCNGFIAFEIAEQAGVTLFFVLYTTLYKAFAPAAKTRVYTPELTAYDLMAYAETWDLRRLDTRQCDSPLVDAAWYWSTWADRSAESAVEFVMFSADATAAYGNSIRAALAEPEAVQQHFYWRGHLQRLWPNAGCKLGPLGADARTGCRAKTCATFSTCPFDYPVGGGDAAANLCFRPHTTLPTGPLDAVGLAAAWPNSTHAGVEEHPAACRDGMCLFDVTTAPGSVVAHHKCACPGTGFANADDHACDSTFNTLRDEGSGVCRFPLLSTQEKDDCGTLAGTPCAPGRFGDGCGLYDVDGACHAAGAADMCGGHGTCVPRTAPTRPSCDCDDGWAGKYCAHPTCEDGCGAFGKCVAVSRNNADDDTVDSACLCAVHATLGTPLSFLDSNTGTCATDLCNDHLGGQKRRYGTLVFDPTNAQTLDGAPLATCACTANAAGTRNGGPMCDEPACANACNVPGGTAHPAYTDVCVGCDLLGAAAPECDVDAPGIGAACDCTGSLRQGVHYWATQSWRYGAATERLEVLGRTYEQCAAHCGGQGVRGVGYGDWDALAQACVCTNTDFRGDTCDEPSCPNGVYSRVADECIRCKPQFLLVAHDGRKQCRTCQVGYEEDAQGTACNACAAGFVRTDTVHGPVCEICEVAAAQRCLSVGMESVECTPATVTCTCKAGYSGPACDKCVAPAWKVTAATRAAGQVDAGAWQEGACAPISAWLACSPDHTLNVTLAKGAALPSCTCAATYSGVAGASLGDPGDCSLCSPGYQQHAVTDACAPCFSALACDEGGAVGAECPNPGAPLADDADPARRGLDNGLANTCTCDMGGGRAGARCEECSVETKWVPIPNSRPLVCHHCDRDCGANGEVMCGVSSTTCACRGAWTGLACDKCLFCGQGGRCLGAEGPGDPWCDCYTAQGYAKDAALVGTPGEYRAACTACLPGFFMHGIRCMAIAETCGAGVDGVATQAARACVCAPAYLPLANQPGSSCEACAVTHVSSPGGVCGTCVPTCGAHAVCAWGETNGRHGCECVAGWAEAGGACSVCAPGFLGPTCGACPEACTAAGSGGTCAWNGATAGIDCLCPDGSTHVRPGAADSPCRVCTPGVETGASCLPVVTCPANAHSVATAGATATTCVCLDGFVRAFAGGHPMLTPCATPVAVQTFETPPVESTALFATFDLATLAAITGGTAAALLSATILIACCVHCKDRCAAKPALAAARATRRGGYTAVPGTDRGAQAQAQAQAQGWVRNRRNMVTRRGPGRAWDQGQGQGHSMYFEHTHTGPPRLL
jgi:hypothetical protein